VTPGELDAIREAGEALGRLERALHALSDGLELAADTLMRAQQRPLLSDDDRARLVGRAFARTSEEIQGLAERPA
jgi:hypothetical protein